MINRFIAVCAVCAVAFATAICWYVIYWQAT
jgi:hypothetical protein